MIQRIQPTLALLDQGLSIYRRAFVSFTLIAATWFVPVAVITGLVIAFGARLDSNAFFIPMLVVGVFALFLLMIYLVAVLSRVAWATIEGRPFNIREILSVRPLRVFSMAVYTVVYMVLAQIISSIISIVLICPAYLLMILVIGGAFALGETAGIAGTIGAFLIFGLIYIVLIFISGAIYSGLIYGLQPFTNSRESFGSALQESIDHITYRFWGNIGVWGLSSVLVAAVGGIITFTLVFGTYLPFIWLGMENEPLVAALIVGVSLISFIFLLPPLPIWMALLYRRNRDQRNGAQLIERVANWQQRNGISMPLES